MTWHYAYQNWSLNERSKIIFYDRDSGPTSSLHCCDTVHTGDKVLWILRRRWLQYSNTSIIAKIGLIYYPGIIYREMIILKF